MEPTTIDQITPMEKYLLQSLSHFHYEEGNCNMLNFNEEDKHQVLMNTNANTMITLSQSRALPNPSSEYVASSGEKNKDTHPMIADKMKQSNVMSVL